MDVSELLPPPPFDFEKEPLVDCSVELTADRLKGTVAWLIDCIRQQQSHLKSHDSILGNLGSNGGESVPAQDAVAGAMQILQGSSPPASASAASMMSPKTQPNMSKSVTEALESTMNSELMKLNIEKLQHEMNTLPKMADLERQRETMSAELSLVTSTTELRMKESEEKLQTELGTATEELRGRLQRIGDDLLQRLADLESRTVQAESSTNQVNINLVSMEERLSVRIESIQAAAQASGQWAASDCDDNTLVGTSRSPLSPKSPATEEKASPQPKAGTPPSPKPTTPANVQLRPTTPAAEPAAHQPGSGEPNSSRYNDSTNATYTDNTPAKDSSELFALTSMIQTLREGMANGQMSTQKLEIKLDSISQMLERLRISCDEDREKAQRMETDIDMMRQMIEQGGGEGSASGVDAMRKAWLNRAACRGSGGATVEKAVSVDSLSKADETPKKPLPARTEKHMLGQIREPPPSQPQTAEDDAAKGSSVPSELLLDEINVKLEKLSQRVDGLQGDSTLDTTVQELREILMPTEGPALASTVVSSKKSLDEFQKWSKDMDRKFRRIAPLDSQFSDVQFELERLRKLFEFVEKVLPSDASKAMSFFNKHESEKQAKRESLRPTMQFSTAMQTDLVDQLATTLGPDVAFEQHRDLLSAEVRDHEERMGSELANLANAIKGLQREMQQNCGKTGDLIDRLSHVEKRRAAAPAGPAPVGWTQPSDAKVDPLVLTALPETSDADTITDNAEKVPAVPEDIVSKLEMKKALEETKDDVRNWLDILHQTVISALQLKADSNQMNGIIGKLQNVLGSDGLTTENFAMLAKRALLGKCASCDANFNVDTAISRRPVPVSKPPPWPNQPPVAPGPMQMRAPMGLAAGGLQASAIAPAYPTGKLPRIPDARTAKEFPKSKIFKNVSQPELRQVRTLEEGPDMS